MAGAGQPAPTITQRNAKEDPARTLPAVHAADNGMLQRLRRLGKGGADGHTLTFQRRG